MKQFLLAGLIVTLLSTVGCATGPGGYYGYGGPVIRGGVYGRAYQGRPAYGYRRSDGYVWRGERWEKPSRAHRRSRDDYRRDGQYRDRENRRY